MLAWGVREDMTPMGPKKCYMQYHVFQMGGSYLRPTFGELFTTSFLTKLPLNMLSAQTKSLGFVVS